MRCIVILIDLGVLQSSSHSMELVIIALIAVEVVIVRLMVYDSFNMTHYSNQALIRDGPELWQMLVGSEEKERHDQSNEGMAHSE
jgi:hypothetical protein